MKEIDTFDVLFPMRYDVKDQIKKKLFPDDTTRYGIGGAYYGHHPYLPVSFFYICRGYYLQVTVEHEFTVGITSADEVINKILQVVTGFFNISIDDISIYATVILDKLLYKRKRVLKNSVAENKYSKLKLSDTPRNNIVRNKMKMLRMWSVEINRNRRKKKCRICLGSISKRVDLIETTRMEYKNDRRLEVKDEELAAIDIFRITADNRNRNTKVQRKYINRTNCSYENDKNRNVTINCYFKEYERLEEGDIEGANKYKNILRTEVKVKNSHLHYQKRYYKIPKTFRNYFSVEMAQKYFKKYIEPIFYTEPFYRLDVAILEIYRQQTLPDFKKDRLAQFLTTINEIGITDAKECYDISTFDDYIKTIRALNINPLCFSPIIDGKKIAIKQMENFTVFKNSILEDI